MTSPPKVESFHCSHSCGGKEIAMLNCKCQLLTFAPFAAFTGNMDVMVSQVRRSVVSVVQQYSHIRYPCLFEDLLTPPNT